MSVTKYQSMESFQSFGRQKKTSSSVKVLLQETTMCTDERRLTEENYKIKGFAISAKDSAPTMFQIKHLGPGCRFGRGSGD